MLIHFIWIFISIILWFSVQIGLFDLNKPKASSRLGNMENMCIVYQIWNIQVLSWTGGCPKMILSSCCCEKMLKVQSHRYGILF
jgi:hypothetical protein